MSILDSTENIPLTKEYIIERGWEGGPKVFYRDFKWQYSIEEARGYNTRLVFRAYVDFNDYPKLILAPLKIWDFEKFGEITDDNVFVIDSIETFEMALQQDHILEKFRRFLH